MLFLLSYAITNLACFVLKITGTPNFRPKFKQFSWHTAFAGFAMCVVVMFIIDSTYVIGLTSQLRPPLPPHSPQYC